MGIEVVYLFFVEAGIFGGVLHGPQGAFAFRMGSGHMISVCRHGCAGYFAVDIRPSGPGMFILFQDAGPPPFSHDKAVSATIKAAGSSLRGSIIGKKALHVTDPAYCSFGGGSYDITPILT